MDPHTATASPASPAEAQGGFDQSSQGFYTAIATEVIGQIDTYDYIVGKEMAEHKKFEDYEKDSDNTIITFHVKGAQDDDSAEIRINNPGQIIDKIAGVNKVVVYDPEMTIIFEYPLNNPFYYKFKSNGGFTMRKLIDIVSLIYKKIYTEESETAHKPFIPERVPGMYNRCTTHGKYGIWGHDLANLFLTGFLYNKKKRQIRLIIDS